jgi:hypothetical protein
MEGLTAIRSAKLNSSMRNELIKGAWDGLAWLTHHFKVDTNPGHPDGSWVYYYLYGLERAAVLAGVRNLGQHDWYREGADWLVTTQRGDGSWNSGHGSGVLPSTCFALLFLTKATVPGLVKITH